MLPTVDTNRAGMAGSVVNFKKLIPLIRCIGT